MYYIYVLRSKVRPWRYIGSTNNIAKRLAEHNTGRSKSTRPYAPFQLVYSEKFRTRSEALKRERYLKTGKGREELQKFLEGL